MNRLLLTVLVFSLLTCSVRAENWPQWRGASHDGVSQETGLATQWGEGKNILWKLPMPGWGMATPAIWGDRLFVPSQDKNDLVLLCVSTDGKVLWKYKLGTSTRIARTDEGNGASASPCTDGKHVWAFAGSGELACLDFQGNEVWKFNTQERYGKFNIQFGMHSTPLLHGDRLYLQLIHSAGAWVIAIDKATGKDVWKVARKSDGRAECEHSYASPCLWQNGKDAYLITHGNDYAIAHRLEDGSEIWRVGGLNPKEKYNPTLRFVASPVAVPELIVVPSAKKGPVVGLKPDASGLILAGNPYEQWRLPRDTPDVPSPLVHNGLVYLCREDGSAVMCLDAKTGKEQYAQRIHPSRYRASPVYAGGHIYLTARDGTITVAKAGPKWELVSVNRLPEQMAASPAISGGRIYLRGFDALYAIGTAK
jgi:outer membrane protein assembly factor BamB